MFGRNRAGAAPRPTGRSQFLDELTRITSARRDWEYVYLMLEENGVIGVKWERRRGERLHRYRIIAADTNECPHCAILAGIRALAPLLPLSGLRAARVRDQYLLILDMGKLPCPAFGSDTSGSFGVVALSPGWAADCHFGDGNPHTPADCADHRKA